MKNILTELHRKMDEIIGRQERTLSLMSAAQVKPLCFRKSCVQSELVENTSLFKPLRTIFKAFSDGNVQSLAFLRITEEVTFRWFQLFS